MTTTLRMLRGLVKLALLLALCWLAVWGVASALAPHLADAVMTIATPRLERLGVAADSWSIAGIDVPLTLLPLEVHEVRAAFDLSPSEGFQLSSSFLAREAVLGVDSLPRLRGRLSLEGLEITFHEAHRRRRFPFDRLIDAELTIGDLPMLAPRQAYQEVRRGLEALLIENAAVENFALDGVVMVTTAGRTLPAHLYTERSEDGNRLRFDREDLQHLVETSRIDLSSEQIQILSLYPVRVPFLIDLTRQARTIAWRAYPDQRYLRDALRHVAWSYLLTTEFGPEFAKEVTDAQETRAGNTPNERAMDYHNNAVGRLLADRGTPLEELPELVASHPDVVRDPREIDSRKDLLR